MSYKDQEVPRRLLIVSAGKKIVYAGEVDDFNLLPFNSQAPSFHLDCRSGVGADTDLVVDQAAEDRTFTDIRQPYQQNSLHCLSLHLMTFTMITLTMHCSLPYGIRPNFFM
jgi:hypothetical protein